MAGSSGMPIIRDGIQVVGPFSPQGLSLSDSRAKIFVCQPKSAAEERPCAEKITRHLATQAFRRPVTDADVKLLMKFYETGRAEAGGFDSGVTELVTAVLSSPDFLYRAISTSTRRSVTPAQRSGARLAPLLLHVERGSGRAADRPRHRQEALRPRGPAGAGRAHAARIRAPSRWSTTSRSPG